MSLTLSDKKEQREPEAPNEAEMSLVQEEELCVKDEDPAAARDERSLFAPEEISFWDMLRETFGFRFSNLPRDSSGEVIISDWVKLVIMIIRHRIHHVPEDPEMMSYFEQLSWFIEDCDYDDDSDDRKRFNNMHRELLEEYESILNQL